MPPELAKMFARQAAERAAEAEQWRELPVSDRIERLMSLIASGRELLANSPYREAQQRLRDQADAEFRVRWSALSRPRSEEP